MSKLSPPSTDPLEYEDDSYFNMSSIDSALASDISSLSGNSVKTDDLFASVCNHSLSLVNHSLHGRQEEQDLLEEAYERIRSCSPSEVVVIHGDGGTGKTGRVESSTRTQVTDKEGPIASGKLDRISKSVSFSEAFSDLLLCDLMHTCYCANID